MKKSYTILIAMMTPLLALAACSPSSPSTVTAPAAVSTFGLVAEGRVAPLNSLEQAFTIPGQVADVLVKDGDMVSAGQVLARLAPSPEAALAKARAEQELLAAEQALQGLQDHAGASLAQAALEEIAARDALDKAQDRFDADQTEKNQAELDAALARQALAKSLLEELQANGGIAPAAAASAEARLKAARAALEAASSALAALDLSASMSGTVVDLQLQVGQRIIAGAPLITLADLSGWLVLTDSLTEMDVPAVQTGQEVRVTLDAFPDLTFQGQVTHINARYEEKRGDITYTAAIRITQPDPRLRWGMTAAISTAP